MMRKRIIIACFLISFKHETKNKNEIRIVIVKITNAKFRCRSINKLISINI